ncbi:MAG: uracil-DNA glycosylase, partial [Planctomycetota bacterium]
PGARGEGRGVTQADPRRELADLAAGLGAWARRQQARGRRRVAPGEELAAVTLTPAASAGAASAGASAPPTAPPQTPRPTEPANESQAARPLDTEHSSAGASRAAPDQGAGRGLEASEAAPSKPEPSRAEPPAGPVEVDAAETAAVAAAAADLDALEASVAACRACGLCETRNRTVFADGRASARVMFVGEAPGADEDRQGVPFVGRAGQLLSDIITKGMGLRRPDEVYIANVLKCRPLGNRDPEPEEKRRCTPFLRRQIELVDPQVIIPLGRHAAQHLLASDAPMGRLRGRVHRLDGRAVVPTYHPAYLLRSPNMKPAAWADIQLAMAELGLEIPRGGRSRRPEQG